jgi:transposase
LYDGVVSDLATQYWHKICELENKLNEALRRIEFLVAENAWKDTIIAVQGERIRELEEENRRLKGTGKKFRQMIFKENKKQEGESERGAQTEHRASFRRKPKEGEINREVETLLRKCPSCEEELGAPHSWHERYGWDIPIPIRAIITRYRVAQYRCWRCKEWCQGAPKGLVSKSPFGINVMLFVLHEKYLGRATDKHIRESLKMLYGLAIGKGTIHGILNRCAEMFGGSYEGIRQALREGKYVHADETGWRVSGENWYAWSFSNEKAVLYTIENTRGHGIPEKMLKGFNGVVVRDGYQGYDKLPNEHQICLIHLLRNPMERAEMPEASGEMKRLHEQLKWFVRMVRKKHKRRRTEQERHLFHASMQRVLEKLWKGILYQNKDAEKIRSWWLERRHQHLLTFLKYENIPWENNAAERAIRPIVIKRKVCGGSRSQRGAERESINQSCIATILRQGKSFLTDIPLIFERAKKENYKKVRAIPTC